MSSVLLDTHVLHWWSAEPERVSQQASEVIASADELVVADVSWLELALLATRGRITVSVPVVNWLERLSRMVRSAPITPQIAATAVGFPQSFPGDPADRLIYATAIENGWKLVTKDESLRSFVHAGIDVVW